MLLVKQYDLKVIPLPLLTANAANGSPMTIYEVVEVPVTIIDSSGVPIQAIIPFVAADLQGYSIYYGMPFCEEYCPILDF